ncbi:DUF1345 domain-containing protein [Noviherbaspirillum massiliense]|uniref:DUF1345 domain-containing protein n=1 Tax=Noviherbaspirillum massiliense TaxID=1465823 RepID=UPI0002F0698A|nr:DUF1345 domain-containing protein [Noviherbaspirillum massiliense]
MFIKRVFFHPVRRFTRNRPRLMAALGLGILLALLLPGDWQPITRALAGWNVAVWSYIGLMGWLMIRADHAMVRRIAEQENEGAVAVLAILSLAATVSLVAIVFELSSSKGSPLGSRVGHYLFTGSTVLGSWCLLGLVFMFHYARLYYQSPEGQRALRFPDDERNPDYWDFLYFSFTIAVAVQTSDVSVMSREMRKTVIAQSVLSFLFNAAILGLSVNIAASLV